MNSMKRSRVLHGFTLIEMAIVVVIVGIVVSTIATVLPSLIQSAKIKKARAILEKVDYALEGYITANGQCPCPDTDGDGLENRNPGTTPPTDDTCNAYVGDLPYRTLGLSSGEDNWRNPIKYGVYEDFIRTTSSSGSNFFCNRLRDTINYFRTNNPDTSKLYSSDSVGDTNQLYIIVTGGSKDFDGIDGFFDGLNSGTDVQFEAPNKIVDATYDDLVQVVSFNYLRGKDCTGGPGGGGGVENGYPNGCTNGEDDDGDGMEDCNDPDCFGDPACLAGGENVTIATESVPPGSVNSDYSSVTFTASGGITPYEWELLGDGGFTDFYLHPYTGHLSGTLSQCPGSYEIQVQVTDSTQPTPTTNTKSFNIQVSANLDVTRTSGDQSTTIIWDSPTQQETFKTNGGHIGDIDWSLNAGGASGFTVISTGTDTCAIKKDGITTPSPPDYTFTLTATDPDCPTNTASIILTVTVTASGVSAPYTANLSAEWHLDECNWNGTSGEVLDSGSDGIDGTAQNGADTIGSGKVCRAGFFDGIDDYVDMEDSLNDVLGTSSNSFTAVAWIYPLSLGVAQTNHNTQNCFLAKASDPINDNLEIGVNTNGTVHVYIDTTGRDTYADFGIGEITINKWSFVAVSYNNGTVSVTINGTKYENTTTWNGGGTLDNAIGSPVTIGSSQHIDNYFHGKIDEVKFFSIALTDLEIQDIYSMTHVCAGSCYTDPIAEYRMESFPWTGADNEVRDSGSGESHGKAAFQGSGSLPTQTTPSGGKICRAGVFERIDANNGGYLDLGNPADGDLNPGTNSWTISAWINWDGSSGENIIYNKESLYEARVSGGYVQYAWQPHWAWDGSTSFPVTTDTWTCVTTVYDGKVQTLFKDGVPMFSREETGGAIGTNSSKFLIGARGNANPRNFFGGMIDEVKLYNRALAENEINANMEETRNCTADTVVISTMSLPGGTINTNYSTTIAASGGTLPYQWSVVSTSISGLSINPNTGELSGILNICPGIHTDAVTIRVTDQLSRTDEHSYSMTISDGNLSITPVPPGPFTCNSSTWSQDFTASGNHLGDISWSVHNWNPNDPGGFEIVPTGSSSMRLRKIGTSTEGTYFFIVTAADASCSTTNTYTTSISYQITISGEGAISPYYAGMIGEWQMDECTWDGTVSEVLDSSGTEAHGESHNMGTADDINRSTGKICFCSAVNLGSTTNQYITFGDEAFQNLGDFSLCMWFMIESLSSDINTLFSGANSSNANMMLIFLNSTATTLTTYTNGIVTGQFNIGSSVANGVWHHLIWTRDVSDGTEIIYLDGTPLTDTDVDTSTINITLDPGGAMIGQEQDSTGGGFAVNQIFHGWIDELLVYNTVLTQTDVNTLYSLTHDCEGSCYSDAIVWYVMDEDSWIIDTPCVLDSIGTYHGTPTGNTSVNKTDSHLCYAGEFANTPSNESCITISALPVSTEAGDKTTICFWMKWGGNGSNMPIGWSSYYDLYFQGTTRFGFNTGAGDLYGISGALALANNWHHVAAIFNNNAPLRNQLYIDGILQPIQVLIGTPVNKTVSSTLYISGWSPSDGYKFSGLIDEVRIYTRGLSASEVLTDMNLTHSCPTP